MSQLIAISLSRAPLRLPAHVLFLIVPSSDSWNDFGLRVHAEFGIRTATGSMDWVSGFFAIKDQSNTKEFVEKRLLKRNTSWVSLTTLRDPFATMLRNVIGYQQLVRNLGTKVAERIAVAAHDVAYIGAQIEINESWPNFKRSQVFNRAFMRIAESVFAHSNADRIFAGQSLDTEDARQDFKGTVRLGNSSLQYDFEFPRGKISENRLSVIIGKNGTGKTASLIALSRKLLDRNARGAEIEPAPSFNQLLIFAHSRSLRRFKLPSRSPRAASQRTFSLDPTHAATAQPALTRQLATMARSSDYLANPLQVLVDVLASEFQGLSVWIPMMEDETAVQLHEAEGSYLPLESFQRVGEQTRLDRAGQIDESRPLVVRGVDKELRSLSLGQDVFLTFAINAIAQAGPASVFLIDEPENFLHPNLISRFVRLIHRILQETRSIAIVATHSPYVVREVQRSQVHVVLAGENSLPQVEKPRLQTFGANITSISNYIFGDDLVEHLHLNLLHQANLNSVPVPQLIEAYKDQLSLDALITIRQEKENQDRQGGN